VNFFEQCKSQRFAGRCFEIFFGPWFDSQNDIILTVVSELEFFHAKIRTQIIRIYASQNRYTIPHTPIDVRM